MRRNGWIMMLALCALLGGCGVKSSAKEIPGVKSTAAQKTQSTKENELVPEYHFSIGYSGDGYTDFLKSWAEKVRQRTDGAVVIELFGDNILGEGPEMLRAVQQGTLSIVGCSTSVCTDMVPAAAQIDVPGAVSPHRVYREEDMKEVYRGYRDAGLELLGLRSGEPWIISSFEPITGLKDLDGRKIRTAGSTVHNRIYDRLGIKRVENVGLGGIAYLLDEGSVDGIEATYEILRSQGLLERQPYGLDLGLYCMTSAIIMNREVYEQMPKNYQQILKESLEEEMQREEARMKDEPQSGMRIYRLSEAEQQELNQIF